MFILSPVNLSIQVDKENLRQAIRIQADEVPKVYFTAADPRQASSGLGCSYDGKIAGVLFNLHGATLHPAVVSLAAEGIGKLKGNGHESFPVERGGIASDAPSMAQILGSRNRSQCHLSDRPP